MKRLIVDRVDENFVICFDPEENEILIQLEKISFPVKDGDYILYDAESGEYSSETADSDRQLQQNKTRLQGIFNRNKK